MLLFHQILAAGTVTVYSFVGTLIIGSAVGIFFKNRVTEEAEYEGLDTAIHGESAYDFGGGALSGGHIGTTVQEESVIA